MKRSILKYVFCSIFILLFAFGCFNVIKILNTYKHNKTIYKELENKIIEKSMNGITIPVVDFNELKKINSDVVGWIYNENIDVNYPIVQGKDNDFYLEHLIDKSYGKSGTIFLDYRNEYTFKDKHNILYGHHMKDGSMFTKITKYKTQDFYNKNKSFLLITPEKNYKIELISGYVTHVYDESWNMNFLNNDELQNWIDNTVKKSKFHSDIIPSINDIFITFSTCSYEFDNARFILVGILNEFK